MQIPLVDLKAQYASIQAEIRFGCSSGAGPKVRSFWDRRSPRSNRISRTFAKQNIVSAWPAAPMRCN